MLPLLDALLAGQEQALNAATAARTEAEAELDKLQQTLGRAEQAEKLRLELTAAQTRQDALRPVLDAAEAEAARHAGDSAALDALAGKLERAKSDLAAFDGLDSLERGFLPPGTPPPSRTPELKSAAPPSGSWTEN